MIFFANNDGTIIKTIPQPVYQGGAGVNNIYLVAPFAASLSATVAFQLPNGIWTTPQGMKPGMPMTDGEEIPELINKQTGNTYALWSYTLPSEITRYYGTVTAQFFWYGAQTGVVTASAAASFTVGRGVPQVLPEPAPGATDDDIYVQILNTISALQTDLDNGAYPARSIYAWNSTYKYGMGEIVWYPQKGDYGTFVESLVSDNTTAPYNADDVLSANWKEIVDFNVLNRIYDAVEETEKNAQAAQDSANAAQGSASQAIVSAGNAAQSATSANAAAQSVEETKENLDAILNGTQAVPKAVSDETGENIAEHFAKINSYIPSSTSASNKLTNEAFVNSSINNMAAFYITYNAQGDAFPTRADLFSATTYYYGGQVRTPTQNDYAIVLHDESQPLGANGEYPTTRYSYQGTAWSFQYVVNNTSLTQAQVNAINSGITKELVDQLSQGNVLSVNGETGAVTITPAKIGAATESVGNKNLYNLGAYDTVTSNGDGTATITRKTGYIDLAEFINESWQRFEENGNTIFVLNDRGATTVLPCKCNRFKTDIVTPWGVPNSVQIQRYSDNTLRIDISYDGAISQSEFTADISANPTFIQYELASEYQYSEQAIEGQPIHTLPQNGEGWLRREWEKGLNVFSRDSGTIMSLYQLYLRYAHLRANTAYTLTIKGLENSITNAAVRIAIRNLENEEVQIIHSGGNKPVGEIKFVTNGDILEGQYIIIIDGTFNDYSNVTNIMLNEGDYAYSYQPYHGKILREDDLKSDLLNILWKTSQSVSVSSGGQGLSSIAMVRVSAPSSLESGQFGFFTGTTGNSPYGIYWVIGSNLYLFGSGVTTAAQTLMFYKQDTTYVLAEVKEEA